MVFDRQSAFGPSVFLNTKIFVTCVSLNFTDTILIALRNVKIILCKGFENFSLQSNLKYFFELRLSPFLKKKKKKNKRTRKKMR